MPRSRSRSRSPHYRDDERRRSRSRSPRRHRDGDRHKRRTGGFRWKEKRRPEEEEEQDGNTARGLERGYREKDGQRRSSPVRDRYSDRKSPTRDWDRERRRSPRPRHDPFRSDDGAERSIEEQKEKKKKKRKEAKPSTGESMIVVNVNDRLGTKAAIPCLPSDPIKLFKAQVAIKIGRQPHEIMLKRQGERPFKDHLTLADYGVSNGVQLDLELDTGE